MPSFDLFPYYPTRYQLGDVWLFLCNFDYPLLRRGVEPVEIVIYQPGSMAEELEPLVDQSPIAMTILDGDREGNRRETVVQGIIVKEVEHLHDGLDGCRVTITDIRELIDTLPWVNDINLVVYGRLTPETSFQSALGGGVNRSHSLFTYLRDHLFQDRPFEGNLTDDWFAELDGREFIPFDSHLSGGSRSEVLQKLLEQWSFDLGLGLDGKFYIAGRLLDDDGTDPAIEQIQALDMEFAAPGPVFGRRSKRYLRARSYIVPFWEEHNLQVWFGDPLIDDKSTGTGAGGFRARSSGMILVNAYKGFEDYFTLEGLLVAAGIDSTRSDRNGIQGLFHRTGLRGTILSIHPNDIGKEGFGEDRQRKIVVGRAVIDSERRLYQLRRDPNFKENSFGGGGPGEWLDIRLGRQRPDGTIVPTRPHGFWTLLFNKPEVVGHMRAGKPGEGMTGELGSATVIIGRVFDDKGVVIDGKILEPDLRTWDPASEEPPGPDEDPFGPPKAPYRWTLGHACPFTVRWDNRQAGVVRLEKDERDIGELGRAIMGRPDQQHILAGPEFLGEIIPQLRITRRISGDKKVIADDLLEGLQLDGYNSQEDLTWFRAYSFFILVVARRNSPNDESKFWKEVVDGFDDAPIDEIMLLPNDRVRMLRQYADQQGREGFEAEEDGFGKPQNPEEVREEAERRVAYIMELANEPDPVTARFFNIKACEELRLTGSLDSVTLHVRGFQVECELQTGSRADDKARRLEADLQRNKIQAEYLGKIAKR